MEREQAAVRSTRAGFELATLELEKAKKIVEELQGQGLSISSTVQLCITELSAALASCQSTMREWAIYCPTDMALASSMPLSLAILFATSPSR